MALTILDHPRATLGTLLLINKVSPSLGFYRDRLLNSPTFCCHGGLNLDKVTSSLPLAWFGLPSPCNHRSWGGRRDKRGTGSFKELTHQAGRVGRRCLQSRGQDTHRGPRVLEAQAPSPPPCQLPSCPHCPFLFIPGTLIVPALIIGLALGATGSEWTKGTKFKSSP